MSFLLYGNPPERWNRGASTVDIGGASPQAGQRGVHFGIRCRLGRLPAERVALLDAGAEWSVIGDRIAGRLGDDLDDLGADVRYATQFADLRRRRHRLPITLITDAGRGDDLEVSATVLVLRAWPGPVVLGFRGCLKWIRFGVDPSADGRVTFFFGSAG